MTTSTPQGLNLPEAIVQEAQRLHAIDKSKLRKRSLCAIHLVWHEQDSQLAEVFIFHKGNGKYVLAFGADHDILVDCTSGTLAALARDWAGYGVDESDAVHVRLVKLESWDDATEKFASQEMFIENELRITTANSGDGWRIVEADCLAVLGRFVEVVAAMQPSMQLPYA